MVLINWIYIMSIPGPDRKYSAFRSGLCFRYYDRITVILDQVAPGRACYPVKFFYCGELLRHVGEVLTENSKKVSVKSKE